MIKKLLLSLCVIIFFAAAGYSQGGTLKGTVTNPDGSPVQYCNVTLKQEGKVVNTAYADDKGEYSMYNIAGGTYELEVEVVGGEPQTMKGVELKSSGVQFVDFPIQSNVLGPVELIYEKPVFKIDETTTGASLTRDQVIKTAGHSLEGALASSAGVSVSDGSIQSVRGNREDGRATYVDGVKVNSLSSIPLDAVGETEMIQGGIPAEYGDATSVTNITTRGIPKSLVGGVELRGSIDGYNNFLAAATLLGPLLKGKTKDDAPRIGFMLTAQGGYNQEPRPLRGGSWHATQEAIDWLTKNPMRYITQPGGGVPIHHSETEYLTADSEIGGKKVFQKKRVREFGNSWNYAVNGKIDFMPPTKKGGMIKNRVQFSVGGYFRYDKVINSTVLRNGGYQDFSLFNAKNAPEVTQYEARATARLNHVVFTDTTGKGIVKNISYNINVGYSYDNYVSQSPVHKDRFFDYGYIGKFKSYRTNGYALEDIIIKDEDGNEILYKDMWVMKDPYTYRMTFEPGTANPDLVYYTQNFVNKYTEEEILEMLANMGGGNYNRDAYQMFGALFNGQTSTSYVSGPYALYAAPGTVYDSYSKSNASTIQARASLSISLKNHDIKLGFQFEKETHRSYGLSPVSLWTLMGNEANQHIMERDLANPYIVPGTDTVKYNYLVASPRPFDRNLRNKLGLDPNGTDWLDINSMDPSTFSLDMFSAEELLATGASPYVSYMGYDHTGKKYNRKTSVDEFFNGDSKGYKYGMGAYEPVYMAMYIQDKFSIKNLIFNVGVRVDRFDANQPVLKDPYLFRQAYTVGDMLNQGFTRTGNSNQTGTFVANAGDDWVVYVGQKDEVLDAANFSSGSIVGYRQGNTWYNADGQVIADPNAILGASGGPILKNAINKELVSKVEAGAFEDYKPQWSVMPRISFAFPVNMDNSLFFANYSIITTRPTNLNINLVQYLLVDRYLQSSTSINNPNLKPQQSVDYEIGFKQKIGARSAVNISAYYSEKKDMIQSYRFSGAYPSDYYSYYNLDFGTVQGITLGYTLQKTKGIALNVSYSIQFAKGTGSSAESQKSLVASRQPNLRTLTNLTFDQRHNLSAMLSYEFGSGTEYPAALTTKKAKVDKEGNVTTKEIRWLENVGIYLTAGARSGMPYSRSSKAHSNYVSGTSSQLTGSLNGSFKPWQFQCDLHIEKGFNLVFNNKKVENEKAAAKRGMLTVYLDITNLLNLKNILSVYDYTGSADDDGYLSAEQYQQNINSQFVVASFTNYYEMRMKDPYNYARPCRVNLGLQLSF